MQYSPQPNRRLVLICLTCCALVTAIVPTASAAPGEILLWPHGAPGSEGKTSAETVRIDAKTGDHVVSNVNKPSITPWLPPAGEGTGAAIVVAPGGGHRELWVDHEGRNEARWLSAHGIAAFVLKYRLSKAPHSTYTVDRDELADIQRAIRLVRSRASAWGIDPHRLGVMGFSAGGELAGLSATRFDAGKPTAADPIDRQSSRPDFAALIYPGRSWRIKPSAQSPPAFLACGSADRPDISEGITKLYLRFKRAGVPVELHIYSGVHHGFGMRPTTTGPVSKWIDRFYDWMAQSGFLKKA